MSAATIDLNADVGERTSPDGIVADAAIIAAVSSANIACGFHAGDAETMRAACETAVGKRKRIGAHVSHLDHEHFGRGPLELPLDTLRDQIVQQIRALRVIARLAGGDVVYVKPHGTVYNRAAIGAEVAEAVVRAVVAVDASLKLLGPPDSELLRAAQACGLDGVAEGFPDRAYHSDGTLAPRGEHGAVLDHDGALAQALRLATEGRFRSLCIHGDTPGAPQLAITIRNRLIGAGFEIRPFA